MLRLVRVVFFVIWRATAKRLSVYLIDIERRYLIYKIVQPVRIDKVCMTAPTHDGFFCIIVVREVVFRHIYRKSRVFIAQILVFQSVRIVFGMTRYKYLLSALRSNGINARFFRRRKDFQFGMLIYILTKHR